MIKSRQYRQYNSNVTFDVYQYNYLNENDTPLQITTNNIYTINGSLVIYIKFNDLDLLNIDKLNYLFINLWLDDLSSIDSNNTFEFKLFQTSISNDNPLDTVRVCDTIFNDNNLIDKFTLNNGDRCVRLKILKSDLIYSRIYMIQVKPLDNMCVANLKGINEYNDLLYPLVITYYEDMRYKDDNINKDISMKNGINSKIDIQSLTTIAHVPLQSIQSNFINCSFSFYIGKEYDF